MPLIYVADGNRYIVANARPSGERNNPWVLNLRSAGAGRIKLRGRVIDVMATELDEGSVDRWWPALVEKWPAFAEHYANTGDRSVFMLEPIDGHS